MADKDEAVNASNQTINTTQPKVMRGLILRGVKPVKEVLCVKKGIGANGEDRYLKVPEEDYDRRLHGEKVDKLPKRAAAAKEDDGGDEPKKKKKKKAKAADSE